MEISTELLARYVSFMATASGLGRGGYSQAMQTCMILERVAGDMMDRAAPEQRAEICSIYQRVIAQVMAASRASPDDA